MRIHSLTSVEDARLEDYRIVRDPELVRKSARFVAEGRIVVKTLLTASPWMAVSVLCDERALAWLTSDVGDAVPADVPVFVVPRGALRALGGLDFHQGCLALGDRPAARSVASLTAGGPRVLVALDRVSNPDNVGAIFRTAAAFGAGGVFLHPGCASPLYRKALRTSMGAALRLPFSHGPGWRAGLETLLEAGYVLLGLTPDEQASPLEEVAQRLPAETRRVLVLGAEGDGLGVAARALAAHHVAIPLTGGVDSLNVAAAAAVALYRLRS